MIIRPETAQDISAIALVHTRAFEYRTVESLLVMLHRQRAQFDPELSLVAELDGQIVGHALFSPQTLRLLGEDVATVNLAPLAVDPAHQRSGIGTALMEEGHRVARSKGITLSFLLGHPTYYPRFGYQTHAYGSSSLVVNVDDLSGETLQSRPPVEGDVPALHDLWRQEEANVDFAIDPGPSFLDWISPNPAVTASVYRRDGEIVGYTRGAGCHVVSFLARDHDAARGMVLSIAEGHSPITLPLHPASASAGAFAMPPTVQSWEAGMALSLESDALALYYDTIQRGERAPGRPVWPVAFDIE